MFCLRKKLFRLKKSRNIGVNSMKVAFWLNAYNDNVDYKKVELSNPGIGGTEFLFWTTSYFLKKYHPEMSVYLISSGKGPFPTEIISVQYNSEVDVFEFCKKQDIDYLVIRGPYVKEATCHLIKSYQQKTIVWSHNLENYPAIKQMENNPYIVKNVCVSNEQLYWLKDTRLYDKSTFIYNGLCFDEYRTIEVEKVSNRICYMGNLYPKSGIESVAFAWKEIRKKFPDAELWIIGGNNLYDVKLMQASYSKKSFRRLNKIIQDTFYSNGKLDEMVHFTGVLRGREKLEVMASAQLGIANITDAGDTFGLAAVEFQALGVPVVSIGKYGVIETVDDENTGVLLKDKKSLADEIVKLLNNPMMVENMAKKTRAFVFDKFDIKKIVEKWYNLFRDVNSYEAAVFEDYRFYGAKRCLNINCLLKKSVLLWWFPSVAFYKYLCYGFRRVLEKLEII